MIFFPTEIHLSPRPKWTGVGFESSSLLHNKILRIWFFVVANGTTMELWNRICGREMDFPNMAKLGTEECPWGRERLTHF